MSYESGGRSDKFGNDFERDWMVGVALRVIEGRYTSLLWEPLGTQGDGIEGIINSVEGRTIDFQCKVGNGSAGKWTVEDLHRRGILATAFRTFSKSPTHDFLFVSSDSTPHLRDIRDRSQHCDRNAAAFRDHSLSKPLRKSFGTLCHAFGLDSAKNPDVIAAFALLERFKGEKGWTAPEGTVELQFHAARLIRGDGALIVDHLVRLLSNNIGNTLYANDLRRLLREAGFVPRDLMDDPTVPAGIENLNKYFDSTLAAHLIQQQLIFRHEAELTAELLRQPDARKVVLLHGMAGSGKSGVLLDICRRLKEGGIPILCFSCVDYRPEKSVHTFASERLGLPASPVACLHSLAAGRPSVLVIDQLDSLRWTASHSHESWRVCQELLDEAVATPRMSVLIACRTFDLHDSQNIHAWESRLKTTGKSLGIEPVRVEVAQLSSEHVRQVVANCGCDLATMDQRLQQLLQQPIALHLWTTIAKDSSKPSAVTTKTALLREYFRARTERLVVEKDISVEAIGNFFETIVQFLDKVGRQEFSREILGAQQYIADALVDLGVLTNAPHQRLRFSHQSLLDYQIGRRVFAESIRGNLTVIDWIMGNEQSLFRRDQLRQALTLMRDESEKYPSTLRELITAKGIRFHLRHLALGLLREVDLPTDQECGLVADLLEDGFWREHVIRQVLLDSPSWFEPLCKRGIFRRWLDSDDDELAYSATWVCRSVAEQCSNQVTDLLRTRWKDSDRTRKLFASALDHRSVTETDEMFEWKIELVKANHLPADVFDLLAISQQSPSRGVRLFAASCVTIIEKIRASVAAGKGDYSNHARDLVLIGEDFSKFLASCQNCPVLVWDELLPLLQITTELSRRFRRKYPYQFLLGRDVGKLNWLLRQVLAATADRFQAETERNCELVVSSLAASRSTSLRRLALQLLCKMDGNSTATFAVELIRSNRHLLELAGRRSPSGAGPAARVIRRFAAHCAKVSYEDLETFVLSYHPQSEVELAKRQIRGGNCGYFGANYYGRSQYILLSALPKNRMSDRAKCVLRAWRGKFGDARKLTKPRPRPISGWPNSSIPTDRIGKVSNDQWIKIVTRATCGKPGVRLSNGNLVERSRETYARALGQAAIAEPSRFAALATQFPTASVHDDYFEAVFWAIAPTTEPEANTPSRRPWKAASVDEIERLIRHLGPSGCSPWARALCYAVRQRAKEVWSSDTLHLVASWMLNHPDPAEGESKRRSNKDGNENASYSMSAINTARGAAMETLTHILFEHPDLVEAFLPSIESAIEDAHPAARMAATALCQPVFNRDQSQGVDLFLRVLKHPDDHVLLSVHATHFLRHVWRRFPSEVTTILHRMAGSELSAAQTIAGYWATIGEIVCNTFIEVVNRAPNTPAWRKGAANAVADLTSDERYRRVALERIANHFFDDSEKDVREQAANIFRKMSFLQVPEAPALALTFVKSKAFSSEAASLTFSLRQHPGRLIPFLEAIDAIVSEFSGQNLQRALTENKVTRAIYDLPSILLKLYEEAEGPEHRGARDRCLDLWDTMLKEGRLVGKADLQRLEK